MNGVLENIDRKETLQNEERKPIITYAGDTQVFKSLEENLLTAIPQEPCEWRRNLGRPARSVRITVRFKEFNVGDLPKDQNDWQNINLSLFHTYWTECSDVETYKSVLRDDIENWLRELNSCNITDWLIIVVESYDARRSNKLLPRTTVLDKIRADFANKQPDRCISVFRPCKSNENRPADSWRGMISRVRHLMLMSLARAMLKLEEHVRNQREKRNEIQWNFVEYFKLQEELALRLESLEIYDESLVQYDELDAIFTQFVLNLQSAASACDWLNNFGGSLTKWHGLQLMSDCAGFTSFFGENSPDLLELRSYLFARQACLLLRANRPWEMASRCLPFLHACVLELDILEVSSPPGSVNCWLFLACLEVLQICDTYNHSDQVELYSLYTAGLWAYSAEKLRELGELCGLLPGMELTSQNLHIVVQLSAGMGDYPGKNGKFSPTDKLKEALCSKEAFKRHYLELSELAVGTYKHIGRLRSAKLVGRQLASFYKMLGETQKAAVFLSDALKTFQLENWRDLSAHTKLELAQCYKLIPDVRKYVRSCSAVAGSIEIDTLSRCAHFDEMLKNLAVLDRPLTIPFGNNLKIISTKLCNSTETIIQDTDLVISMEIESCYPKELLCTEFLVSLDSFETDPSKLGCESIAMKPSCENVTKCALKPNELVMQKLKIFRRLDYKQDGQIGSASVICKNTMVRRADSVVKLVKGDFTRALKPDVELPFRITPGPNTITLKWKSEPGRYSLGQTSIQIGHLEILSQKLTPKIYVDVKRNEPSIRLDKTDSNDLLSGIQQTMLLKITIGSYSIPKNTKITLRSSKGLTISILDDPLKPELEINLDNNEPFAFTEFQLKVFAELNTKDHKVVVCCPWLEKPINVPLDFCSPLSATWRLHTAGKRKFVQVVVSGKCARMLKLDNVKLESASFVADEVFRDFNPSPGEKITVVASGLNVSYMWELLCSANVTDSKCIKTEFSVNYTPLDGTDTNTRCFTYHFDIVDYQTLYTIESRIDPSKGSEFLRMGALCHLKLTIRHLLEDLSTMNPLNTKSLMYEVLAEQSVWAVCGRTAGVISLDYECAPQMVTLDVMPLASGHLPLPLIRLSKYIPAEKSATTTDGNRKAEPMSSHPRLEPFGHGQVYNASKARQVHVLAPTAETHT